eukprot:COSAG02_NODE_4276_length_5559_cov_9.468132_3_plen_246_part_00
MLLAEHAAICFLIRSADFDGGVRVNAFVTGGAVPLLLRSTKRTGLMHVTDLHATLCRVADAQLAPGVHEEGVPALDTLDMWDYMTGLTAQSPRTEVPLSTVNWHGYNNLNLSLNESAAVIVGQHKLVVGSQGYLGFWMGPLYPNASTPCGSKRVGKGHTALCGAGCGTGCVFNIYKDPGEHHDLSKNLPQVKEMLLARLQHMREDAYQTDGDHTPLNVSDIAWTRPLATAAKDASGGFWSPFAVG